MKIILWAFLAVGLIITFIAFICWLFDKDDCSVILSFEKFHRYWKKDPDKWDLQSGWTHYHDYNDARGYYVDCYVCFPFTGWIQYRLWKLFREKLERDERLRKLQMEFEKFMEAENGT